MELLDIWHGDSREVLQMLPDDSVDCVITDPPFGVNNQSNSSVTEAGKKYARKIANDETPEQAISVFNEVMDVLLPKTRDNADLYIFTAYQVLREWLDLTEELGARHGFVRKAILVWEKDGPGMGDLESWGQSHEFILFLKKGRAPRNAKRRSGVIHTPQLRPNKLIHPHEKPEQLLEQLIKHSTTEGQFIVDPFGGSGSLVRAARNCNRQALAVEYDEFNYNQAKLKFESQETFLV